MHQKNILERIYEGDKIQFEETILKFQLFNRENGEQKLVELRVCYYIIVFKENAYFSSI